MSVPQFPKRLRTVAAAQYLEEAHGVSSKPKTIRNLRARGEGPRWEYFGNVPYTRPEWVDAWVEQRMTDRPANRRGS